MHKIGVGERAKARARARKARCDPSDADGDKDNYFSFENSWCGVEDLPIDKNDRDRFNVLCASKNKIEIEIYIKEYWHVETKVVPGSRSNIQ